MWPFKRNPKPIWKQISRKFLKTDMDSDGFERHWFAVTYEDVLSGQKKVEEVWNFDGSPS